MREGSSGLVRRLGRASLGLAGVEELGVWILLGGSGGRGRSGKGDRRAA